MRTSQCASAHVVNDYLPSHVLYQSNFDYSNLSVSYFLDHSNWHNNFNTSSLLDLYQCCGPCGYEVGLVDLYYWPERGADTSCLSIITQATEPLDYGATINDRTYWGCTGLSSYVEIIDGTSKMTTFEMSTVVAEITSIGSLLTKIFWYSPWSSGPCKNADTSVWVHDRSASIHAGDQSLILPDALTQEHDSSMSTTVLDGFTL